MLGLHQKTSRIFKSGDHGGHTITTLQSIYLTVALLRVFSNCRSRRKQCGGAANIESE